MSQYFLLFFIFAFLNQIGSCVYLNTQNCNANNCQLPDCYCPSVNIPGGLRLEETPQFIFFTLDDSLYEEDFIRMGNYSWFLNNPTIRDSLGCTIKLSWYALEICIFFFYIFE